MLYGKPVHAHMYIERIPVENVPEDEAEASKWLQDLFVVKVYRYIIFCFYICTYNYIVFFVKAFLYAFCMISNAIYGNV